MIAAGRTHPGRLRKNNEDTFLVDQTLRLVVVADGMGGHQAGEVASRLAVEAIATFVRQAHREASITWPYGFTPDVSLEVNMVRTAIRLAHQEVLAASERQHETAGMGSTVVVLLVENGRAIWSNVGDSRLYLLRDGVLRQQSTDHSWAASMKKAGASPDVIDAHPMRHMLTHAIGSEQDLDVQVAEEPLQPDDLLLLSTDGLHGVLGDDRITAILRTPDRTLDDLAAALVDAANEAGGPDNITAVLVRP